MPTAEYKETYLSEPTAIYRSIDILGLMTEKTGVSKPFSWVTELAPFDTKGLYLSQEAIYTNFELSDETIGLIYYPIAFEKDNIDFGEHVARASTNRLFTAVIKIRSVKKSSPKVFFEEDLFEE